MTDSDATPESADGRGSRLMDALLESALTTGTEQDESRIRRLMSEIRDSSDAPEPASMLTESSATVAKSEQTSGPASKAGLSQRRPSQLARWIPISLAASLLVAVIVFSSGGGSTQAALTALDRIIEAEQSLSVREYAVTITFPAENRSPRLHSLFVRQNEFVISTPATIGRGEHWAGGQGDERWLVPRVGPVFLGKADRLPGSLPHRRVLETPFLSVETILQRTRRFYELSVESAPSSHSADSSPCTHIVGRRVRSPRFVIPEYVDIEADPKTGFVRYIRLDWNSEDDSRWASATAELVGTPEVPVDFFQHNGHHDGSRKVIQLPETKP